MKFEEIFGAASWITPSEECGTPYMRTRFSVSDVADAKLIICGLGFYYAYINGKAVSDDLFVTLSTEYHEHPTVFSEKLGHRIICQKYDVTELLKNGENALGVLLGGGYYRYPDDGEHTVFGNVKLCFRLEIITRGGERINIYSSDSVRWSRSAVFECDNFLCGETYDCRMEQSGWNMPGFNDEGWKKTVSATIPKTEYEYMCSPADRIAGFRKPKLIYSDNVKKIYDVGENITGWAYISFDGSVKDEFTVRFSEELQGNGLCEENVYGQYYRIIPNGVSRTLHPLLTWHGFRYVEVPICAEMTDCAVIHSYVPVIARFESSNGVLNWIYKTYLRTQLNNMHCGIPTDCPTIERRGYTGDGQLCCEAAMLMLDAKSFYRKWINDIADCQDENTGHIQYTAPVIPSGGGPGGWGCAIVRVPYIYYKTYGETDVLTENFDRMLKYFDYLDSHSSNGLVVSEQPGCWCLGDWCTSEKTEIPEPFVNTYFYVKSISAVIEIAETIGRCEVISTLCKKREYLKAALVSAYYNSDTGDFCGGIQGANAFAVDIGIGDGRTLKNLVSFYREYGMFNTGIFGTDILPRVLFENGEEELAYKLLSSKGKYSFGNWQAIGATTLWEYWTGERSHDHPMFGACSRYLFSYILGIRQAEGSSGYRELVIAPAEISLEKASGSIEFESGTVSVGYKRSAEYTEFSICIPEGVSAVFRYLGEEKELKLGEHNFTVNELCGVQETA